MKTPILLIAGVSLAYLIFSKGKNQNTQQTSSLSNLGNLTPDLKNEILNLVVNNIGVNANPNTGLVTPLRRVDIPLPQQVISQIH